MGFFFVTVETNYKDEYVFNWFKMKNVLIRGSGEFLR